jgi:hypothetical protein
MRGDGRPEEGEAKRLTRKCDPPCPHKETATDFEGSGSAFTVHPSLGGGARRRARLLASCCWRCDRRSSRGWGGTAEARGKSARARRLWTRDIQGIGKHLLARGPAWRQHHPGQADGRLHHPPVVAGLCGGVRRVAGAGGPGTSYGGSTAGESGVYSAAETASACERSVKKRRKGSDLWADLQVVLPLDE